MVTPETASVDPRVERAAPSAARRIHVTFLTPTLPPRFCGLGDHSRLLAEAMTARGASVSFVALHGDPALAAERRWPGPASVIASLDDLPTRWPDVATSDDAWLWVQLSGYGYSPRGAPFGLARALRAVHRSFPRSRVAVCLHEPHVAPRGRGWKGPILWALQRAAVGAVVREADVVFSTHARAWDVCATTYGTPAGRLWLLPIAANVPRVEVSAEERASWRRARGLPATARVAVVFGQWDSQRHALERFSSSLQDALKRGELARVLFVGGGHGDWPAWTREVERSPAWGGKLEVLGPKPAPEVGRILALADVGVVSTPWVCWEKSGAARAYQQAGLELWIHAPGERRPRVLRRRHPAPTWDELATNALTVLGAPPT